MTTPGKLLALFAVMAMVLASCGGSGTSDDGADGTDIITDDGGPSVSDGANDGSGSGDADGDTGTGTGSSEPPDLDPGSMPPAGEVSFQVDGRIFTIRAEEMDYFICELNDDFTNVRSESETLSLAVQYDPTIARGNASLISEDDGIGYNSFLSEDTYGGIAIETPHLVFEANFDVTQLDNIADVTQVGPGRVEVTCP